MFNESIYKEGARKRWPIRSPTTESTDQGWVSDGLFSDMKLSSDIAGVRSQD